MITEISEFNLGYIAGLLEGEGCFYCGDRGRVLIRVAMTDEDTIQRVAVLMGGSLEKPVTPKDTRKRTVYSTRIRGSKAIAWMERLYPYMSTRRQLKITEILTYAAARPGRRYNSCGGANKPRRGAYGLANPIQKA